MGARSVFVGVLTWCVKSRGRASRTQFWLLFLAFLLTDVVAAAAEWDPLLAVCMVMLVPLIAVGIRRLHDTGRPGGWLWLVLSMWGWPFLIAFLASRSQPHENRFGPPLKPPKQPVTPGIVAVSAPKPRPSEEGQGF